MNKIKDIIGNKYERLLVIKFAYSYNNRAFWECLCDCGKITVVSGKKLREGKTKSCGCFRKDFLRSVKAYGCLPPGEAAKNALYANYKQHAKNRNIKFLLSREEFLNLNVQNCHYCNSEPANKVQTSNGHFIYNGIDRLNNRENYTLDNCVPCCKMCNWMKNKNTYETFFKHIKKIVKTHESKF